MMPAEYTLDDYVRDRFQCSVDFQEHLLDDMETIKEALTALKHRVIANGGNPDDKYRYEVRMIKDNR